MYKDRILELHIFGRVSAMPLIPTTTDKLLFSLIGIISNYHGKVVYSIVPHFINRELPLFHC